MQGSIMGLIEGYTRGLLYKDIYAHIGSSFAVG